MSQYAAQFFIQTSFYCFILVTLFLSTLQTGPIGLDTVGIIPKIAPWYHETPNFIPWYHVIPTALWCTTDFYNSYLLLAFAKGLRGTPTVSIKCSNAQNQKQKQKTTFLFS